jgi:8-oxo-dGTP diphosphatase
MAREPIHAAGGIVLRGRSRPRIAVVRRSKDDHWVLPRGKLKRHENPRAGAKREALEETGHRVEVYEFLGAITYLARGRPKLVQFWRMQAAERPSRDLTADIEDVDWLPLPAAIRRLSFPLEKLFLRSVGRRVLRRRRNPARRRPALRLAHATRKRAGTAHRHKTGKGKTRKAIKVKRRVRGRAQRPNA